MSKIEIVELMGGYAVRRTRVFLRVFTFVDYIAKGMLPCDCQYWIKQLCIHVTQEGAEDTARNWMDKGNVIGVFIPKAEQ